jgi:AcrR family transcriptional regulator
MPPRAPDFSSVGKDTRLAEGVNGSKTALFVAHPGHELRVHGWLERTRPLVFVLTDGSGGLGKSRIGSTQEILEKAGARRGPIFGRFTDRELYQALVEHRHVEFLDLAMELARTLVENGIEVIVGDAAEGYNSGHDVCRLLLDAAVERMRGREGRPIENRDFPVIAAPETCPAEQRETALWFELDESALSRKLAAARAYSELAHEVEAALNAHGSKAFGTECLRLIREPWSLPPAPAFYEEYGSKRVKEGVYHRVVRQSEHLVPLARTLEAWTGN